MATCIEKTLDLDPQNWDRCKGTRYDIGATGNARSKPALISVAGYRTIEKQMAERRAARGQA